MLSIILLAISLSLDAFSLSFSYGIFNISNRTKMKVAVITGLFHFIMPIIGNKFGNLIFNFIKIDTKYILILILVILIFDIIKSYKEKVEYIDFNFKEILLFSLFVSFDSLTIGIGIDYLTHNIFLASLMFMLFSFSFTYIGFVLGEKINSMYNNISKSISILILFTLLIKIIFS